MEANSDGYSFHIYGDSDDGGISDSSDEQLDEVNVLLHGTPEQKRKILKSLTGDEDSSDDDDFEKFMDKELNKKIKKMESDFLQSASPNTKNAVLSKNCIAGPSGESSKHKTDFYDDIYFDSDEEESGEKIPKQRRKMMSNDELFYDPNADDEDEKWVLKQREKLKVKDKNKPKALPNSDAVLDCPSCMSTLCLDCQRHSSYKSQYRAMFVLNCNVKTDEILHYKHPKKKTFKRHKKTCNDTHDVPMSSENFERSESNQSSNETVYNPVMCSTCNTEVAVYDTDEIYHFFNVLASHA